MRNLNEIIEACKLNEKPDVEELRYAVVALTSMLNMDHSNLRKVLLGEVGKSELTRSMMAKNSYDMYHNALNKSPKEWLGWTNDPENPDYQAFHAMGNKLLDKFLK